MAELQTHSGAALESGDETLSRLLSAAREEELIPAALELAQDVLRATVVGVALLRPERAGLHVEVSSSDGRLRGAAVAGLARQTMQASEALLDPFPTADRLPVEGEGMPEGSALAFPLKARGAMLGALVLWREQDLAPFTLADLRGGKTLAAEIALALDNVRLRRELSRSLEELTTAHSAVARAEAHAQAIIDAAQEGIVLFDTEGVVQDFNPQAAAIFGWPREEAIGRNLADIAAPPRLLHAFKKHLETAFRVGRDPLNDFMEVSALRRNGEEFPMEISTSVIETPGGKFLSTFCRDITERKRAEQALRESEERYRLLFENNLTGVFRTTREGHILDINRSMANMLGCDSPEEALAHPVTDFYFSQQERDEFLGKLKAEGGLGNFEIRFRRKDGSPLWVLASINCSPRGSTGCQVIDGTLVDITERKRAEAAMAERHRLATLLAEVGVALTGAESLRQGLQRCAEVLVLDIDAAFARVWTLNDKDNLLELQASAGMYTHLDGGHARVPLGKFKIGRIAQTGEPHLTNTVLEDSWVGDPDWARREGMVAFAGYPLKVQERVLGVVAAFARKPLTEATLQAFASVSHSIAQFIERKRAEEALRDSEEKHRALIETTGTGYVIVDAEGRVIDANPEYVRLTGRAELAEVVGHRITEWTAPEEVVRNAEAVRRCAEAGFVRNHETVHVNRQGKRAPIEVNATVLPLAGGDHIVALCRDITDRKHAELALRESEERYRLLFERNLAGFFRATLRDRRILDCNDAYARILGYDSPQEVLNCGKLHDFYDPAELEVARARLNQEKTLTNFEVRFCRKDRTPVWILANVSLIEGKEGEEPLVEGTLIDITKRKQAEQALAQERDLLRALMDNVPDYIYFKDRQSRFLRINAAHARAFGISDPGQAVGKTDFDFFTAEHAQQAYDDEQEVIRTGKPMTAKEEKETWPDGRETWASTTKMPFRDAGGAIIGSFGVSRDITSRKQMEERLREISDRLQLALKSAKAGTWSWNAAEGTLYWDDYVWPLYGLEPRRSPPNYADFVSMIHPDDRQAVEALIARSVQEGRAYYSEFRVIWPDGSTHFLASRGDVYQNAARQVARMTGVTWDMTEGKRAEEALRTSELRYRLLFERNLAGVFRATLRDRRILDCNDAYARILGYDSRKDVLDYGKLHDFYDPAELEVARTRLSQEKALTNLEVRFCRKDGTPVWVLANVSLIEGKEGEEPLVEGTLIDISKRKRAEQALWESEAQLSAILNNSSAVIYLKDAAGRYIRVNREFETLFGFKPGHVVGKTDHELFPKEVADNFQTNDQRVIRERTSLKFEETAYHDGSSHTYLSIKFPLYDASDRVYAVAGISTDITERKRAEEALRKSEQRYRRLFERNLAAVFQGTMDGHILDCNDAYARILGYDSRQEILRLEKLDYFYDAQEGIAAATALQREGSHTNLEIRLKRRDGSPVSVLANVTLAQIGEGRPPLVEGTLIDISERKRAEEQTRILTAALEFAANGIVISGREGNILWVNPAFTRLTGYPGEEVLGQTMRVLKSGQQDLKFYQNLWQTILGGGVWQGEVVNRRKDGTLYTDETTIAPVRDAGGAITHFIAVKQDITERKRAEEAIRASEERYRELFENASDLVFTADLRGHLTSLNQVAAQTIGYCREEATQITLQQLVDPRHHQRIEQTRERLLAGDPAVTVELEILAKDGRRVVLEVKPRLIYKEGKPVAMQGIGRDITGREAAEVELRQAQKLESVGRLAAGIAHEINTPIQFVGDNTRFLQDSFGGIKTLLTKYQELRDAAAIGALSADLLAEVRQAEEESDCAYLLEEIPKALSQTLDGVTRVATIVRAMKDFAHPESKARSAADLNKALQSTLTVARNELKYVADVETDFGELPLVVCNISDLNQVFLNLLVNAAHAIGEVVKGSEKRGKIRVRTVAEGKTVLIAISDTGCGIPEGIRSKVFDPFFTTKEVGRGTGQGLAIARSVVVERHKGSLSFDSEEGKGTTFYVRLPVEPGEQSEEG